MPSSCGGRGRPRAAAIDSKFPGDAYEHLLDAQESGDAEAVAAARKTLDTMVKREAKDICEKYLSGAGNDQLWHHVRAV